MRWRSYPSDGSEKTIDSKTLSLGLLENKPGPFQGTYFGNDTSSATAVAPTPVTSTPTIPIPAPIPPPYMPPTPKAEPIPPRVVPTYTPFFSYDSGNPTFYQGILP